MKRIILGKLCSNYYERIENRGFSGHDTMVESDHDVALEDTDRIHGRTALVNNVRAASSLAGAIRSTLGPKGLDKMLVDGDGSALVTNDGVTVLEKANVEHPTARLLRCLIVSRQGSTRWDDNYCSTSFRDVAECSRASQDGGSPINNSQWILNSP